MESSHCSECGALIETVPNWNDSAFYVAPGSQQHKLLNSNDAPLDSEDMETFRSAVLTAQEHIARIDSQISRQREQLDRLEAQRNAVSNHLARNKSVLSPLRRIPPELLSEIFSWTLPSILTARRRDKLSVNDPPWILGHISSHWRAVAHSTPSLWSLVTVNYTGSPDDPIGAYPLPMLEAQIGRAQTLKIHFYASQRCAAFPQIQMFGFLAKHASRWEELSLSLTSQLVPLLATIRDRVPSLCRLWLQWDAPESQEGVGSIDCFESAPSLVDVGVYNEYRHVPVLLPFHQLTRYHLDAPWATHEEILRLTKNLIEARIDIRFDQTPWPDTSDIIELPSLRRLYISEPTILDYIRVKHLQELAVWMNKEDGPDMLSNLEALLVRSSCSLSRLCLKGLPTAHTTAEILNKVPSIVELGIIINESSSTEEVNTLMANFTVSDVEGATPVAPQLAYMFFGCDNTSSIDYGLYLEMVTSRWKAGGCALNGVALLTDSDPGPETVVLSGLRTLREEGLDVFLLNGSEASEVMGAFTNLSQRGVKARHIRTQWQCIKSLFFPPPSRKSSNLGGTQPELRPMYLQMSSTSVCSGCGASQNFKLLDLDILPVSLATLARLRDLLNTNEPPDSAEMAFLRSAVSQTDARLALLGTEISRLRDRLTEWQQEHALLSRYRAQNRAILSPLRRMPPEVLGEIFSWSLPPASDAGQRERFQNTDSPWILTHVNRR
ncbi:hypothetical protein C8R43DRAFT_953093 [Mycena crocata]|nr:hypothetical protein C8R43DRAFT_953093 [Mycena crocata]